MKLTIKQLKQLIKEQVEDLRNRAGDSVPPDFMSDEDSTQSILVLDDGETYSGVGGWFITGVTEDEMEQITDKGEKVSSVIDLYGDLRAKKIGNP